MWNLKQKAESRNAFVGGLAEEIDREEDLEEVKEAASREELVPPRIISVPTKTD